MFLPASGTAKESPASAEPASSLGTDPMMPDSSSNYDAAHGKSDTPKPVDTAQDDVAASPQESSLLRENVRNELQARYPEPTIERLDNSSSGRTPVNTESKFLALLPDSNEAAKLEPIHAKSAAAKTADLPFDRVETRVVEMPVQGMEAGVEPKGHRCEGQCEESGSKWELKPASYICDMYSVSNDVEAESFDVA